MSSIRSTLVFGFLVAGVAAFIRSAQDMLTFNELVLNTGIEPVVPTAIVAVNLLGLLLCSIGCVLMDGPFENIRAVTYTNQRPLASRFHFNDNELSEFNQSMFSKHQLSK